MLSIVLWRIENATFRFQVMRSITSKPRTISFTTFPKYAYKVIKTETYYFNGFKAPTSNPTRLRQENFAPLSYT